MVLAKSLDVPSFRCMCVQCLTLTLRRLQASQALFVTGAFDLVLSSGTFTSPYGASGSSSRDVIGCVVAPEDYKVRAGWSQG